MWRRAGVRGQRLGKGQKWKKFSLSVLKGSKSSERLGGNQKEGDQWGGELEWLLCDIA